MPLFEGVVPPVVTPLTPNFDVDYEAFNRVVDFLLDAGDHGLFVLGSTSEVVFHDEKTRLSIIERALKRPGGRVPVLAGVIDTATDRVIEQARAAQSAGVDAVVATAPFYART